MSELVQSRSILVVDDEPTLRMAFSFALRDEETHVQEASDGVDALAKLALRHFDMVLMDLRMPLLTGLETVAHLRARGDLSPVVLCSAHLSVDDALEALRHGVVDFLSKPVELGRLRRAKSEVFQPPSSPWAQAMAHARRMDFRQALEALADAGGDEDKQVWSDTFRTLAWPDLQPTGFFDPATGRQRTERLLLAS